MNRKSWHAAIHGVAKSRTRLSDWTELTFKSVVSWAKQITLHNRQASGRHLKTKRKTTPEEDGTLPPGAADSSGTPALPGPACCLPAGLRPASPAHLIDSTTGEKPDSYTYYVSGSLHTSFADFNSLSKYLLGITTPSLWRRKPTFREIKQLDWILELINGEVKIKAMCLSLQNLGFLHLLHLIRILINKCLYLCKSPQRIHLQHCTSYKYPLLD